MFSYPARHSMFSFHRTMSSLLRNPLKVDPSTDREQLLTKIKDLIATSAKCFNGHEQHVSKVAINVPSQKFI